MKAKLKQFVSKVLDSGVSFDGVTDEKCILQAITENKKLVATIKEMFPTAAVGDPTKPVYYYWHGSNVSSRLKRSAI